MDAVTTMPNKSHRGAPRDLFAEVGAFLAQHRLGADPDNYAFAYSVVSNPDGVVASAVARIAEDGFRVTAEDIERLGFRASAGVPVPPPAAQDEPALSDAGDKVDGLIARTQVQVDGFVHTMRTMHAETRGFGRDLAAAIDPSALQGIEEVARLTEVMIERVRITEVRLEAATREADELRTALDEARGSARRDPLTDLPNRRALDEAYAALAPGEAIAVAICDVDHFKSINDRFGHAVGDRVLRAIAQTITTACPECVVARYGGEEFVVLVRGCDSAALLMEAVRAAVESRQFRLRETQEPIGTITISCGFTALLGNEPLEDAMARADRALYAAKEAGRNAVICAD